MRLFEYQAKGIFQDYGIPIPKSQVTSNAILTEQIRDEIRNEVVLKAQVLIRGRAKAGGIRLIHSDEDIVNAATEILNLSIKGKKVKKILVEEAIQVQTEYFLKIEIDPYLEKPVLIGTKFDVKKSINNGMEATENRIRIPIDLFLGLLDYQTRKIAVTLGVGKELWDEFSDILNKLWRLFKELDALSVEINPLVLNERNQFLALGALIEVDDRALFRHGALQESKEYSEESRLKTEAEKFGILLSEYEGNISCIVNGNGLGTAIMDILHSLGGHLGFLLDIGGGAGEDKIFAGLDILNKNRKIQCILVAVFGGLTLCDRVANGIIKTISSSQLKKPLFVYLNGTNSEIGKSLLNKNGFFCKDSLFEVITDCLEKAK